MTVKPLEELLICRGAARYCLCQVDNAFFKDHMNTITVKELPCNMNSSPFIAIIKNMSRYDLIGNSSGLFLQGWK